MQLTSFEVQIFSLEFYCEMHSVFFEMPCCYVLLPSTVAAEVDILRM